MDAKTAYRIGSFLIYALVALLNIAAHWFPWAGWPSLSDGKGRLRRIFAYVFGVGSIAFGFILKAVLWLALGQSRVEVTVAVHALLFTIGAAAIGTLTGYGIDAIVEHRNLVQDREDYEQALEKRID